MVFWGVFARSVLRGRPQSVMTKQQAGPLPQDPPAGFRAARGFDSPLLYLQGVTTPYSFPIPLPARLPFSRAENNPHGVLSLIPEGQH